ncbi:MAG: ZIP family metal transporter [Pirellulaceae bacterium]|nr:ZIP family metal transporter [Pirellulaceae bacterium]
MWEILVAYCVFIVLASVIGGTLPSLVTLTHRRVQLTLSFVSGVMLGVALLHLLPHSLQQSPQNLDRPMLACLCGLLFMFLLIRCFHFHHHEFEHAHSGIHEHHGSCGHHHSHPKQKTDSESTMNQSELAILPAPEIAKNFSWLGLAFGLGVHTLIDGLALAAAFSAERLHSVIPALGTFLAIVLHKPLDAMTITALMRAKKATFRQQTAINLIFALTCPIGAILFALSISNPVLMGPEVLSAILAFSAGVFLCISLGDLLPEVHFHTHDRIRLSLMLLLGILIAWGIDKLLGHSHSL